MKGLFTLLALVLFLHSSQAQWQFGASPSEQFIIKRGLERVGDELWMGTAGGYGLYRSLDGHSWFQADFFPSHVDIYDIYEESATSVLILTCDRGHHGNMTVYRLKRVGKSWEISDKFVLPVNCCSNIAKVFRAGDLVVTFNESWDKLIAVYPDSLIAYEVDATRMAFHDETLVRSYFGSNGFNKVALSVDDGFTWTNVYQTSQTINAVYVDASFVWVALSSNQKLMRINRSNGQVVQTTPPINLNDLYLRFATFGDSLSLSTDFDWWYSLDDGINWQMVTDFQGTNVAFDVIEELPEWPVAYGQGNDMIRSDDSGESWYKINAGIGAYSVLSLEKNGSETCIFAGVDNPDHPLYRSLNGGASWQTVATPFTGHQFNDMERMGAQSMFVLEGNDLYFTPDIGQTWTQLSDHSDFPAKKLDGYFWKVFSQSPTAIQRYNVDGTFETTLNPSPASPANPIADFSPGPGEWFLQMQNGDFYFSTDQGQSWTFRSHPFFGQNPLRLTRSGNNLIWWAADRVLYSMDKGATWLPAAFPSYSGALLNDVTYSDNAGSFAALSESGVFASPDDGATWLPLIDGLYNPNIYSLLMWQYSKLFAGSHRGGVWNHPINSTFVRGLVFRDDNGSGWFESGEAPLPNVVVKAMPSGKLATTDAAGRFFFTYSPGQNDVMEVVGMPVTGATANPAQLPVMQANYDYRFAVTGWPTADLYLNAASSDVFRTGETNTIKLEYGNKGSDWASDISLQCVLPAGVDLLSAVPMPDFVNGDTLRWLPAALPGGALEKIVLEISLEADVQAGDFLRFQSSVQSNPADADASNNEDVFQVRVQDGGAPTPTKEVDRNTMTLSEIAAGKPLEFTLRFQNTGSSDAHLMVISDVLDASLDPATLQLVGSSHPCVWKITGPNKLTITFPDLNLPPVSDDPEGSMGYARFSVKARTDVQLGTVVTNLALFSFDYGQPFWSNSTQTKVEIFDPNDPLLHLGLPMGARPNPGVYYLIADWNFQADAPGRLKMTDMSGVVWVDLPVAPGQHDAQFDVVDLPNGAYVLFVDAGSRHFVRTVVVAHPDSNRRN